VSNLEAAKNMSDKVMEAGGNGVLEVTILSLFVASFKILNHVIAILCVRAHT
jgi:hypothetical protein